MNSLKVVYFEVTGKVQGVFFRKHTKKTCIKYGLTGWVLNTTHGSVQGFLEGNNCDVDSMKRWLQTKGSPKSRIDRCEFYNEKNASSRSYSHFSVLTDANEVRQKTFKT